MEQQDIDKFVGTIENSKFIYDCAKRKQNVFIAFKSADLSNAVETSKNAMKRFSDTVRI